MEGFEPHENGQTFLRILDPGFRDPGRILSIFLETGEIKDMVLFGLKGNINVVRYNRNK